MSDDVIYLEDEYKPPTAQQAPRSLLDFLEALAPIAKYYVLLLFMYYVAKRLNRAIESEADLEEKERKRPNLSTELMASSSEEEDEEEEKEDEIYEELTTDGTRLLNAEEAAAAHERKRQADKLNAKVNGRSHPLFEGLKQVEEELRQKKQEEKGEAGVSWNELHKNMLKRYQQKYPDHGLHIQESDDYDDEFKDLLQKHNVRLDELKKDQ